MKKINLHLGRKKMMLIVAAVALVLIGLFFVIKNTTHNGLTDAENEQIRATQELLKTAGAPQTVDTTTTQEIDNSLRNGKHEDAKQQIYKILERDDLPEGEETLAYSSLARACIPLKDLDCVQKVVDYQVQNGRIDYYFLVDGARLAKELGQAEKARDYYKIALRDIDAQGGEEFLTKANENTEQGLDYQEIKFGAQ